MAFFKFRKGFDGKAAAAPSPQESIETMRRRAKHRLVGATVLVLVAVIGFPLLFDAQPRPVSVDIPIEIPDKDKVKPLTIPPALAAPTAVPVTAVSAPVVPPSLSASSAAPAKPSVTAPAKPAASAPAKTAAASPAIVAAAASIGSKEEIVGTKPAAKGVPEAVQAAASATSEARFVVQVGAFADAEKAREVRQKLERAGMKTYAQVVDTKDGKRTRVRVGPFADKSQAEQQAEKIKALDLPVVVLAL